jgi:hypothetical protein
LRPGSETLASKIEFTFFILLNRALIVGSSFHFASLVVGEASVPTLKIFIKHLYI